MRKTSFSFVKFHWEPDCCPSESGPITCSVGGFTLLIPEELDLEAFLCGMISVINTQRLLGFGDILLHPPLFPPHPSFDSLYIFAHLRFHRYSESDSVTVGKEGKI